MKIWFRPFAVLLLSVILVSCGSITDDLAEIATTDHIDNDGIPPDTGDRTMHKDGDGSYSSAGRDHGNNDGIPPDDDLVTAPNAFSTTGYFGRVHGDSDGIPPDGQIRTNWGAYPSGGLFDEDQDAPVQNGNGG